MVQVYANLTSTNRYPKKVIGAFADKPDFKLVLRHSASSKSGQLFHQGAAEAYAQKGGEGNQRLHRPRFRHLFPVVGGKKIDRKKLVDMAGRAGLDRKAFAKALDDGTHAEAVARDRQLQDDAELPTLLAMNGRPLEGLAGHTKEDINAFLEGK